MKRTRKPNSTPTKSQLRETIDKLTQQIINQDEHIIKQSKELAEREEKSAIPTAYRLAKSELDKVIPNRYDLLSLDHVDDAGYFFNYRLHNGSFIDLLCIRITHEEVEAAI